MDGAPFLSSLLKGKSELRGDYLSGTNDSVTSYEEIPSCGNMNGDSSTDGLRETSRGAVMQALQNLQEKIHRLELERSDAETDMRQLASETAQFRQMLARDEEKERGLDETRPVRGGQNRRRESPRTSDVSQPDSRANAVSSLLQSPKSTEIALASAETRCTILEKQLSYMRTLLETAERDRNAAQRRSRSRGEQLMLWRHEAESQLKGLEEELRAERRRNRMLCENASQLSRNLGEREEDEEEVPVHDSGLLCSSTPAKTKKKAEKPPFVVGRSGPSHNVHANLQTVLGMLNKTEQPTRRQRRERDRLVEQQLQADVGVVLEELLEEFDALCTEHQALVRRLAEADDATEKTRLQQRLADLVNRMEVKGQQIGRLRSYTSVGDVKTCEYPTDNRREKSLHLLKSAKRWQASKLEPADVAWR